MGTNINAVLAGTGIKSGPVPVMLLRAFPGSRNSKLKLVQVQAGEM